MYEKKDRRHIKHSFTTKLIENALKRNGTGTTVKFDYDKIKLTTMNAANDLWREFLDNLRPHRWDLEKISLDLTGFSGGSNDIFRLLEAMFAKARDIKSLSLILRNRNMTDQNLRDLGKCVRRALPSLKKLFIDLSGTYRASEKSLEVLTSQIKTMNKLKDLTLIFNNWSNINNAQLSNYGGTLAKMHNLERLELSFSQCHGVGDEGVKSLESRIHENLTKLRSLGLKFCGCFELSSKSLEALGSQFYNSPRKFDQLRLNFAGCDKFTDEGVIALAQGIKNHLNELKSLSLVFYCCDKLTDKSIEAISDAVCKHSSTLKVLELNFYGCNKITEGAINIFGTSLGRGLKKLEKLSLNFSLNNNITDEGLRALASEIGNNMKGLHELALSFSSCSKISDHGLNGLAVSSYKNLRNLKKIWLFLNDCSEISDQGLKALSAEIVQNCPDLQYFRFGFIINSQKVTTGILSYLRNTFHNVPGFNLQCY